MATKYLDSNGLLYLWQKIRNTFVSDVTWDSTNRKLVKRKKTGTNGAEVSTDLVTFAKVATTGSYDDLGNRLVLTPANGTVPQMDGTASVGDGTTASRSNHVHPTDTSRAPVSHASSATTYGTGSGTNYGHLKLSSSTTSTSDTDGGTAATPKAVKDALASANSYTNSSLGSKQDRIILDDGTDPHYISSNVISDSGLTYISIYEVGDNNDTFLASIPTSVGASAALANYIPTSQKGAASGVCPLNSSSKIDSTYYTDTKNTAGSTDSSSKLFLVGATSQAANPQTYSQDTAYVGTDGHLYSDSKQVVNLSGSQALTNKTYNGYTLGAACAKGVVTSISSDSADVPTVTAVKNYVASAVTGSTAFQGTAPTSFAPTNYKAGYYWVIGTAGTYAGQTCEAGDMIFATQDGTSYSAADFDVIQTNLDITSITNAEIDAIVAA